MNVQVYSASKHYQDIKDAPSAVTIVTAEDIELFGYRTLAEVLSGVNGFFVTNDRNYSYLGVRGFAPPGDYNGRILLMVDGHRLNENVFDEALIGAEFPVDIDQIERVEIVRGPSSSLYGTSAFFAVINVITKKRSSVQNGKVSFDADSFDSYQGHFAIGTTVFKKIDAYLAGKIYDNSGHERLFYPEFNNPVTNNGFAVHCDDESSNDLLANLAYGGFRLQAVYGSREKGIPTAPFGTLFNDPRTRTVDTQSYLDLGYERKVANRFEIMTHVAYDWYIYQGSYVYAPEVYGTPDSVLNRDLSRGDWLTWEGQFRGRLWKGHRVTAGTDVQDNLRQDQKNYNVFPYSQFLNSQRDSANWGIYAQDEFTVLHRLSINAGFRHDQYSTFGGTTNPRLGIIYSPFEATHLKFLYGQAFRAPTVYELYYEVPGSQKANPSLRPETIRTYEGVLDQNLAEHLLVSASAYEYTVKDLIAQQVDPSDQLLVFQNAQRIRARGLELAAEGKWQSGMQLRFGYAVQRTRDADTELIVPNSPEHLAKTNLVLPVFKKKLFLGFEGHYMSSRQSLAGTTVGGFGTANITLFGRRLLKGLDLSATVYNVFDKNYSDPAPPQNVQQSIPQDGRSVRIKLAYSF